MAVFCGEGCKDCCDFCIYFSSSSLEESGIYDGDGYCRKHDRETDPGWTCEDFHCFKMKGDC